MEKRIERKTTRSFHKDGRPTFVLVDGKLFAIMESIQTLEDIKRMPLDKRPHIRHLNEIPERSPDEQSYKNKKDLQEEIEIYSQIPTHGKEKVTSLKKAIQLGVNVTDEVKKLLKEKEEAFKCGDKTKARKIRMQLRKLDYKRNKGE